MGKTKKTKARRCRWCARNLRRTNPRQLFCGRGCIGDYERYLGYWRWNHEGTNRDAQVWRRAGRAVPHWYVGHVYANTGFVKEKFIELAEERTVDLSCLALIEAVWAGGGLSASG